MRWRHVVHILISTFSIRTLQFIGPGMTPLSIMAVTLFKYLLQNLTVHIHYMATSFWQKLVPFLHSQGTCWWHQKSVQYLVFIYPPPILMESKISTIAQFRVIDYGMESCSLAITTPPKNDTASIISSSLDLPVSLEVWRLATKHKLDVARLTWATRPQPRTHVGTLAISHGTTYHMPRFECRSGSYQTFELSCSSPNCHIDIMGVGKGQSGKCNLLFFSRSSSNSLL